jgi:AraC-like DNA-binding protein
LPICQVSRPQRQCSKNKDRSVAIARVRQRPFAGHCPFGIWELAVPIVHEQALLAVLYIGHFRTSQPLAEVNGVSYAGALPPLLTAPLKRRLRRAAATLAHTIEALVSNWHRRGGSLQAAHPPEFYRDATIRYIDTHFSQPVCLSDYAAQLHLHPNHLGKTIRQTFGRGFLDLLRERRLEEARLLLRITDQPITQIAFSCGFTDSNYFSTVFHHHTGFAPRNYRDWEARQARR